jgi:hypothetical protein
MKNFFKTDRSLLFHVIFALVCGVFFGNFLGNKIITEETLGVVADVYNHEVYIFQSGIYYDEISAQVNANQMKELGYEAVVVKELNKYYVYHSIATSDAYFEHLEGEFENQQLNYFVKKKVPYTMIEKLGLDENDELLLQDYDFYYETINYYLRMLKGQSVTFSDAYLAQINDSNMELFNNLNALNNNLYSDLSERYELLVYKSLAETLL